MRKKIAQKTIQKLVKSLQRECKFCGINFHQTNILNYMNKKHLEEMKNQENDCTICNRK